MDIANKSPAVEQGFELPVNAYASPRALWRATGGAAIAAAAIMVLVVLPAEADIDPTGVGSMLGLTGMATAAETPAAQPDASAPAAVTLPDRAAIERTGAWRQDEMRIELAPHSGQEVKAHMKQGDTFLFEWQSQGGPVKVDMHGERPNATDGEFTSYWEERELSSAQGTFTAPYEGTHGWYWRNKGETPVTVTVRTAGFYRDLFQPAAQ
jgi:hypothetical protein